MFENDKTILTYLNKRKTVTDMYGRIYHNYRKVSLLKIIKCNFILRVSTSITAIISYHYFNLRGIANNELFWSLMYIITHF